MRVAVWTTVLICGFVLPGQTRPLDTTHHRKQHSPAFCGWIGVQVNPVTRAFADSLGMVEPYGAIFGRSRPAAKVGIEAL